MQRCFGEEAVSVVGTLSSWRRIRSALDKGLTDRSEGVEVSRHAWRTGGEFIGSIQELDATVEPPQLIADVFKPSIPVLKARSKLDDGTFKKVALLSRE